ncbi:efflux RND transporter periplasmic adaptor subunit [Chitinophaga nivalis]|uniref:Efflux RND transporter periplasmic adaptor subunit n=1 Tax=Chitinophaga nivalis TaxID=2991709 RepID=A0ABT3IQ57_9BACT|nr:efflux RND transporter periplasmic adaptor subunit [Chitinophaga nivalis]MCW3464198.1 efflux RND transporter periplasmic adaptor subunit [Chitinophaga nivalis]MCW3486112.1 efflux RND transporter periplasmic adaptor subunit [Chitinophaga nivalis]
MRNSYIVNILLILLGGITGLAACKAGSNKHTPASEPAGKGADTVVRGAHKEQLPDSSITRLTQPVNARVIARMPVISPEGGSRIFSSVVNGVITYDTRNQTSIASRVGGRIERLLIKYNYQPVRKGQLIMEIYSPDLAAAQRELLYVAANGNQSDMLARARQRLSLLGMSGSGIDQVLKTRQIVYRIPVYSNSDGYILEKSAAASPVASPAAAPAAAGGGDGMSGMSGGSAPAAASGSAAAAPATTPVLLREGQYVSAGQSLFTVYGATNLVAEFAFPSQLAAHIRRGQKLLFYPATDNSQMQAGNIGLIEPVFRNGQNFMLGRVYLGQHTLRPGTLINASVPVVYTTGWWLPKKAVWRLGNKTIVFKQEQDVFIPVEVTSGVEAEDWIQLTDTVSGDWKVAANAAYLVDSESFIKTTHQVQ